MSSHAPEGSRPEWYRRGLRQSICKCSARARSLRPCELDWPDRIAQKCLAPASWCARLGRNCVLLGIQPLAVFVLEDIAFFP